MITAEEVRNSSSNSQEAIHKESIESKIRRAVSFSETKILLGFDIYGYDMSDVDWLHHKYGYNIVRNGACLWWEISW